VYGKNFAESVKIDWENNLASGQISSANTRVASASQVEILLPHSIAVGLLFVKATNSTSAVSNLYGFQVGTAPIGPMITGFDRATITTKGAFQTLIIFGKNFRSIAEVSLTSSSMVGSYIVGAGQTAFINSGELRVSLGAFPLTAGEYFFRVRDYQNGFSNAVGINCVEGSR
jgi:hypothetical protein